MRDHEVHVQVRFQGLEPMTGVVVASELVNHFCTVKVLENPNAGWAEYVHGDQMVVPRGTIHIMDGDEAAAFQVVTAANGPAS